MATLKFMLSLLLRNVQQFLNQNLIQNHVRHHHRHHLYQGPQNKIFTIPNRKDILSRRICYPTTEWSKGICDPSLVQISNLCLIRIKEQI